MYMIIILISALLALVLIGVIGTFASKYEPSFGESMLFIITVLIQWYSLFVLLKVTL